MKGGAENRKKTLMAGGLGAVALCCILYAANALFGGSSAAPVPVVPTTTVAPAKTTASSSSSASASNTGLGVAPGVAAKKMASTSSSLDPTLDESAMLRTESLVYSGTGRNIFSAIYVPPVEMPKNVPPARPVDTAPVVPPGPPPPPPPPPINLKFFGVETRANGKQQAFLLSGDDVYLASEGDIVERKYKIVSISANTVQVEDLSYKNTQTIPLQQN
jgi:hypothetical protein